MSRKQGLERGISWRKEPPKKYGIEKSKLQLPVWAFEALGVDNDHHLPFAIFDEGDWFNGVEEGVCDQDAVKAVFEHVADSALFIFDKSRQKWVVHQAPAKRICAWLELNRYPAEPEVKKSSEFILNNMDNIIKRLSPDERAELLSISKERMAKKQRLLIYLKNIHPHD